MVRGVIVENDWQRLVSWCQLNAPVTFGHLRGPASADQLEASEQQFSRRWPDDLRRWYQIQDGTAWESANTPLPDWRILSLAEMADRAEMFAGFEEDDEEGMVNEGEQQEAGSMAWAFLPSFVPIGENIAACFLFVDTRPGPQFGCVNDWDRDEGALSDEPKWASVTAMLEEVATAVETGQACDGWRPTVTDGVLAWEL
jgi:cell wall assembly regulator SMI1